MAKKVEVEIDIKSNVGESIADLKELKKQLKQTAAGSDEFKKLYGQIDDLEDKIKSSKNASSDWIDSLESAGGPLGMLGGALNKAKVATQSFGGALKATGIGLIVSLLGGLVAAFSQTEGSMKKFEPLLIAMEQIFGGIVEVMQPLIDGFVELAMNVMPYVTQAFKVVYSAVTAVFQSLGKLGSAVVKLFKGDFKGAWEDAKSSVTGFTDNYEAATERFEKGASKMTKTQKENLKKQTEDRDAYLAKLTKQIEAENKLKESVLNKEKAIAMQTAFSEEQKLGVEEAFAKKSYELQLDLLNKKQALYKKDSLEWKELQAEKVNAEADYIQKTTGFEEQRKSIVAATTKEIQDFEIALAQRLQELDDEAKAKKFEKESKAREDSFALINAEFNLKRANNQATFADELDVFDKGRALEREDLVARKASGDALLAFDKETSAARIQIERAQQETKLNIIGDALGAVADAVGKETAAGKALAVAQAVISTYVGANKALATYPPPFGAIAAGTVILGGLLNVKKIIATKIPAPPGGKGAPTSPTPSIPTPTVPSVSAPQINTGGGMNPTAQIGETISKSQKPIEAYVVSQKISSQQALDRRTNTAATFG